MKRTMALVMGFALLAAACGSDGAADMNIELLPAEPGDVSVVEVPAPPRPDPRDASPEPLTEPVFKPAPEPPPEPSAKPVRSDLPTPPPTRRRPPTVVSDPVVPRVPPSQDLRPGGVIVEDDARVASAVSDLADRLDKSPDTIDVLDARDVTWRDGSVGCPTPALAYTHALVPGFLVVLRSGDSSYRYHAAGDLMPFLCETPESPLEGSA